MTARLNSDDSSNSSTVVLGFGPQPLDWLSKAAKIAGRDAIADPNVARMAGANFAFGPRAALDALRDRLAPGALGAQAATTPDAPPGAIQWLACGERGMSSEALFTRLSGIDAAQDGRAAHPYDPSDFRRCRLMLEAVPSLLPRLAEARDLSTAWAALIDAWPELCALMDEETPDWRSPQRGTSAPRLYARIEQLIAA